MHTLATDTSYYQDGLDDSYPHEWVIFRVCDGTFVDPKFAHNLAQAKKLTAAGKLKGYSIYAVYRPGVDVLAVVKRALGTPDNFVTIVNDIESWGGAIKGNHSAEITKLAEGEATYLGSNKRVLAYGNEGDLASIYPKRPAWLRLIVASYGSEQPRVKNLIGWQYTDGSGRWPVPAGLPESSPPFGRCDHNVFPNLTPTQLAAALGVGKNGATMSITDSDAKTLFAHKITLHGQTQTVAMFIANGCRNAKLALDAVNDVKKAITAPSTGLLALAAATVAQGKKIVTDLAALQSSVDSLTTEVAAIRAGEINAITVPLSGTVVIGGGK